MEHLSSFSRGLFSCPIVSLDAYAARHNISGKLSAYLNFGGVTGSSTDALAYGMLSLAKEKGLLAEGQAVAEASGGSFGISLAAACSELAHPLYLVVPADIDIQKRLTLEGFGAKLITELPQRSRMCATAAELAKNVNAYYINYFENDLNPEFHRRITGPAIKEQMGEDLDAVVIGVGSGGTITGVGEHLKAWLPDVKIIAVEPYESMAISGGIIGPHAISGIGAGFVPENYNPYIVDKVIAVTSIAAGDTAKELLHKDGMPAGAASGAVLCAAEELMLGTPGLKNILCIFTSRTML
ncbi:MAG: cysteine synthase family protein [Oscillospiraceae bacterium]